jgi:hypothetical protein
MMSNERWRLACEASQRRAEREREQSPHPWPHGKEWLWVIFLLALFAGGVAAAWVLVPS